jgi:hypothetical protein
LTIADIPTLDTWGSLSSAPCSASPHCVYPPLKLNRRRAGAIERDIMKKKTKRLVLSRETILELKDAQTRQGQGAGRTMTDCQLISCIGDVCNHTDAPCVVETA